jgi:carboxyl-terminal processing protease
MLARKLSGSVARILLAFSFGFALVGAPSSGLAQTIDKKPDAKKEVLDKVSELLTTFAYTPKVDFRQWPAFIESEKAKIDDAKTDDEFTAAVNAALGKFGASHIVFTSPRGAEARRTASVVGIGIQGTPAKDGVLIVRVVPNAPADKVGLVPGDIILTVDGKPASGTRGIAGEEGTTVSLQVRKASGDSNQVEIVRKRFSTIRPEEYAVIDGDTASLTIHTFDTTYDADRVESLIAKAADKKNLILDLRDNGGGAVVNLQHLLGLLLPVDTPFGTFISRRVVERYEKETGKKGDDIFKIADWTTQKLKTPRRTETTPFRGRVIVLINGGSGSASEMAAAALRDVAGAMVVGKKSAGAVLVSVIVPATNGFMLQYPLSDYVTIKGQRLEGAGVKPDIEVTEAKPYRLPNEPDLTLEKALDAFKAWASKSGGS